MQLTKLSEFIDLQDQRLIKQFGKNFATSKEVILARTVKLNEEIGELCNEVLAFTKDQRKEKLDNYDKNNLP
ncbi:MAG: hypothetical protein GF347_03385, partial [Candidatus Moranbacteria bacterium]|nr:hypothetical protein [Candidatus Moranbacteria bacterium]